MEVNDTGFVGLHHLFRQQNPAGDILADLACHIVTLHGVDGGILVGILLLDLFVVAFDQGKNAVIGGVGLPQQTADIAVGDIFLCHLKSAVGHNGLFHQILDLLHRGTAAHFLAGDLDTLGNALDLQRGHTNLFVHRFVGLGYGHDDFVNIKGDFCTVSFNNLHLGTSLVSVAVGLLAGVLYYILWFCQEKNTKCSFSLLAGAITTFFAGSNTAQNRSESLCFSFSEKEWFELRRRIWYNSKSAP